jgi:formate dehydrogenase assembly factor FdhD
MGRVTERRKVIRIRDGAVSSRPDTLVAGEPLEIRLSGEPLAVDLAAETGLTLIGFLRGHTMNVYAGEHRLTLDAATAARG